MLGRNIFRRLVTLTTLAAVWTVYSMVALAAPVDVTGEVSVTGQVTVNGQQAVSNATVMSGSTIVTGADSSATVSLGRVGRVELLALRHGDEVLEVLDRAVGRHHDEHGRARQQGDRPQVPAWMRKIVVSD